jgi:LacI family transcriptional regulator
VVAALDQSRYDLVLFNVESPVHRDEHLRSLSGRDRADGLLIMSLPTPDADLERLTAAGVPIVLVDAVAAGVPSVVTDDVEGGKMATQHLIDLGHRSIGFLGDDPKNSFGFTSSAQRERGYASVIEAAGIAPRPELIRHGPHDRAIAHALTAELLALDDRPTAVFASSDVQATGVLSAAAASSLRVPDDLSVIGFDDIELSTYVGLTTVRQPLFDSGYVGGRLLLEALASPAAAPLEPPVVHRLDLEVVERATTAPPRPAARKGGRRG